MAIFTRWAEGEMRRQAERLEKMARAEMTYQRGWQAGYQAGYDFAKSVYVSFSGTAPKRTNFWKLDDKGRTLAQQSHDKAQERLRAAQLHAVAGDITYFTPPRQDW